MTLDGTPGDFWKSGTLLKSIPFFEQARPQDLNMLLLQEWNLFNDQESFLKAIDLMNDLIKRQFRQSKAEKVTD